MLSTIDADIFSEEFVGEVLVCPVNTVGVMGKGLALEFRRRYPSLCLFYRRKCITKALKIGAPIYYKWFDDKGLRLNVVIFPTKEHWRDPSKYEYIEKGLVGLEKLMKTEQFPSSRRIVFPQIGCGLGGLDPAVVKQMVSDFSDRISTEVVWLSR